MNSTADFFVVLVEPKYGGNVGAVARSMMNFDLNKLYLIKPCKLDDECYNRAMHAHPILDSARIFSSLKDVAQNLDYLVATSSVSTTTEKKYLRNAVYLQDFTKKISNINGKIGLVFGREDYGLYNREIAQCDMLVKIPSSDQYPSLNLSHAVNLVLYELYANKDSSTKTKRMLDGIEKEKLNTFFSDLLNEIRYPEHKKRKTQVMFRRIIGRVMLSKWEYHTFMGVLSGTLKKIRKKIR